MTRQRLELEENAGRFICVAFSPWRFEDFNYGRAALMAAVVDAIADRLQQDQGRFKDALDKANKLRHVLHRWGLVRHGATIAAAAAGLPGPELAAAVAVTDPAAGAGREDEQEYERTFETVAHFHHQFEELIEALGDEVQAVVVFIDDMDRCSAETIVETFEAMRLFLHAPKTAYVVGAHQEIVEAALDGRYPGRRDGDGDGDDDLGHNYLEKMLQNIVAVPPLSEPEALTYINLLFAEIYTSEEQFTELRKVASENRARNQLAVAMNEGIANEAIGDLPEQLTTALEIAAQVGPTLARGLRGNPRQIKRFLNRLLLRLRTAEKRSMSLDADKLAKLMLLEELHSPDFERIFGWHLDSEDGAPAELQIAEAVARGEEVKDPPGHITEWLAQPGIRDWLLLDPPLAGVVLGPYFTFSRDRLSRLVSASRPSGRPSRILAGLQSDVVPTRTKAVAEAAKLEDAELAQLTEALVAAAVVDTGSPAALAMADLAGKRSEVATALFDAVDGLAERRVQPNLVLAMSSQLRGHERLDTFLDRIDSKGSAAAKKMVLRVRRKS